MQNISGNDTVTMAGFTVKVQAMGVMDHVGAQFLQGTLVVRWVWRSRPSVKHGPTLGG